MKFPTLTDEDLKRVKDNPYIDWWPRAAATQLLEVRADNADNVRRMADDANKLSDALMEVDRLRKVLGDVMPLLAECDCIYSDRAEPPCPCRAARNALSAPPLSK
jgi:hypothetical protein